METTVAKLKILNTHSLKRDGIYIIVVNTDCETAKYLSEALNKEFENENIRFAIVNSFDNINFRILDVETAIDKIPIDELELSVRTYNLLKMANVDTIGEITKIDRETIPMSEKTWEEIDEAVWEYRHRIKKEITNDRN